MAPSPAFISLDRRASLLRNTWRALLVPRRLLPTLLVGGALVVAQASFSEGPWAVPHAVLLCICSVLVAPVSFRVLFPEGLEFGHGAIRLLLYGTVGVGLVLSLGVVVPRVLGLEPSFLTQRPSLLVCAALFLVGGWGLARDILMESSLEREKARVAALERESERAQLLALRAHLEPHFLFNTLNAIAEWCRTDGEVAERAVLQLSGMLRAVLVAVRTPVWPLREELALVESLFALHRLRDSERFGLRVERAEGVESTPVLPLVLLPLAENAVKHGPAAGHGGEVRLSVERGGDSLVVRVDNPGPYGGPRAGSDGLPVLRRRLALAYGGSAALRIEGAKDGQRTVAEVSLPLRGPDEGVEA